MSTNKWGYASSVSPKTYDYNISGTYSGSKWPVGPDDLVSYDKPILGNHPGATYFDYKTNKFYIVSPAIKTNWTDKLYLFWKQAGTTNTWASSNIITAETGYDMYHAYNKVAIVSGSNGERLLFTTYMLTSGASHSIRWSYSAYASTPYSSASSWNIVKISTSSGSSGYVAHHFVVSDDRYVITYVQDINTTTTW